MFILLSDVHLGFFLSLSVRRRWIETSASKVLLLKAINKFPLAPPLKTERAHIFTFPMLLENVSCASNGFPRVKIYTLPGSGRAKEERLMIYHLADEREEFHFEKNSARDSCALFPPPREKRQCRDNSNSPFSI